MRAKMLEIGRVAGPWLPVIFCNGVRAVFLLLLLLCAFPVAAQEWSAGAVPGDPEGARVAWTRNADGHVMLLRGEDDGKQ